MQSLITSLAFFASILSAFCYQDANFATHFLRQGEEYKHSSLDERFQIYCYMGKPKYIIHTWQTVRLQINVDNDNYEVYEAPTAKLVANEYSAHRSSWKMSVFSWKQKQFVLDPFNQSCLGIESSEKYTVHLNVIRVDYWKVSKLVLGVLLFLWAQKLSRNVFFHYACGISFGMCASFLILIYFVSKLFPRRPMMYGVAICGWSIGIYILQLLWENVRVIVLSYQTYVIWYACFTGIVSFIVCYRMGPVSNPRTLNLIQWTLQTLAMVLIFFSSQFQEAAMGQIVLLVFCHNFPKSWLVKSQIYLKKKFPPRAKFISNAEYYEQAAKETKKGLDELRKYCSSPECNQWKTMLKLKDSKRFASFMEGEPHISDPELMEYETSLQSLEVTDDEEYTDEED